jgi:hypothetical protein
VSNPPVPTPTNPVGPTAYVDGNRNLADEKLSEMKSDQAKAKTSRFEARRVTAITRPVPTDAIAAALMYKAAANNPFEEYKQQAFSTFVANLAPMMYILTIMDAHMLSTRRWTDNCGGWVPPYSQMYISVLAYVQIFRAMNASGALFVGDPIHAFLTHFESMYPLNELWIPGPLAGCFSAISAFWPSINDEFGNVTPFVKAYPGWNHANHYRFTDAQVLYLPNISIYISRLRTICTTATAANMDDATFANHVDGPNFARTLFGQVIANTNDEQAQMSSPAASFAYGGDLRIWTNAATKLTHNQIPTDLAVAAPGTNVANSWPAALRLYAMMNDRKWFGPVSAIMAKYSQFFKGSVSLGECSPVSSAAGSIKCDSLATSTLWAPPEWHPAAGTGTSNQHGNGNAQAHYELKHSAELKLNARCSIREVPDFDKYAGITFALNCYHTAEHNPLNRDGPFWQIRPDTSGRDQINLLPGIQSTIMREFHSDNRIDSSKQ